MRAMSLAAPAPAEDRPLAVVEIPAPRPGPGEVALTVEAGNARAIRLYERHGFRTIGRMPRSILVDGVYYDELQMFRTVSSSD